MLTVPLDRTRLGMSGWIIQDPQRELIIDVTDDTSSMLTLSRGDTEENGMTHHGS